MNAPARGALLALLTAVLWGTVPLAGKLALGAGGLPGSGIAAGPLSVLRLLAAAACFWVVLARRGAAPPRRPPALVWVGGLGLAANYVLYMWGLERAGPGTTQVLIQVAPLFLIVLSGVLLREWPRRRELLGGAAAFVGVVLVTWSDTALRPDSALGIALVLASAVSWSMYAVAHKRLGRDHRSGDTMAWIFLLAGCLLLPTALFDPGAPERGLGSIDAVQWCAIVYLTLNTIVAYGAFAECLRHIPAGTAAVIVTLGPVVTFGGLVLWGALDLPRLPPEPLPPVKWVGAALVLTGVGAAVTARARPGTPRVSAGGGRGTRLES